MTNALALCQNVARNSGMFSGTVPVAFTGQVGDLAKVVAAVIDAYSDIQTCRRGWLWLQGEFTGAVSASNARYTAASWNLTRWAEWLHDTRRLRPYSIYLTATGVSDESKLVEAAWEDYVRRYVRGVQTESRPGVYAISPAGEFCFGPVPDAAYTIRGQYAKGPQILAAGTDEPEMPARFHRLIELKAEMFLHQQEEGYAQAATTAGDARRFMSELEHAQLPLRNLGTAGPIA